MPWSTIRISCGLQANGGKKKKKLPTDLTTFPQSVLTVVGKRYGLRQMVGQVCWSLTKSVDEVRSAHQGVETFARFLEEGVALMGRKAGAWSKGPAGPGAIQVMYQFSYDAVDLLFYLEMRWAARQMTMPRGVWTSWRKTPQVFTGPHQRALASKTTCPNNKPPLTLKQALAAVREGIDPEAPEALKAKIFSRLKAENGGDSTFDWDHFLSICTQEFRKARSIAVPKQVQGFAQQIRERWQLSVPDAFEKFERTGSGLLRGDAFKEVCEELGLTPTNAEDVWCLLDVEKKGYVEKEAWNVLDVHDEADQGNDEELVYPPVYPPGWDDQLSPEESEAIQQEAREVARRLLSSLEEHEEAPEGEGGANKSGAAPHPPQGPAAPEAPEGEGGANKSGAAPHPPQSPAAPEAPEGEAPQDPAAPEALEAEKSKASAGPSAVEPELKRRRLKRLDDEEDRDSDQERQTAHAQASEEKKKAPTKEEKAAAKELKEKEKAAKAAAKAAEKEAKAAAKAAAKQQAKDKKAATKKRKAEVSERETLGNFFSTRLRSPAVGPGGVSERRSALCVDDRGANCIGRRRCREEFGGEMFGLSRVPGIGAGACANTRPDQPLGSEDTVREHLAAATNQLVDEGLQEAGGTWTKEMAPVKEALLEEFMMVTDALMEALVIGDLDAWLQQLHIEEADAEQHKHFQELAAEFQELLTADEASEEQLVSRVCAATTSFQELKARHQPQLRSTAWEELLPSRSPQVTPPRPKAPKAWRSPRPFEALLVAGTWLTAFFVHVAEQADDTALAGSRDADSFYVQDCRQVQNNTHSIQTLTGQISKLVGTMEAEKDFQHCRKMVDDAVRQASETKTILARIREHQHQAQNTAERNNRRMMYQKLSDNLAITARVLEDPSRVRSGPSTPPPGDAAERGEDVVRRFNAEERRRSGGMLEATGIAAADAAGGDDKPLLSGHDGTMEAVLQSDKVQTLRKVDEERARVSKVARAEYCIAGGACALYLN
eukprot:g17310.t1